MNTDTPRTDACWGKRTECNILEHARQLERELNQQQKWKDEWIECGYKQAEKIERLERELALALAAVERGRDGD